MKPVSNVFQSVMNRIQPTGGETRAAGRHFQTIRTRFEAVFTVKRFFAAGSFSRETFIRGRSDVDVFEKVTLDEIRWGNERKSSSTSAIQPFN